MGDEKWKRRASEKSILQFVKVLQFVRGHREPVQFIPIFRSGYSFIRLYRLYNAKSIDLCRLVSPPMSLRKVSASEVITALT